MKLHEVISQLIEVAVSYDNADADTDVLIKDTDCNGDELFYDIKNVFVDDLGTVNLELY